MAETNGGNERPRGSGALDKRDPLGDKAAAHDGQVRADLERAGTPCGPHDMQIRAIAVGVTAFLRV